MTKISVLIPVFNSEKYLKDCIKSVVNQTLKDIEIIIINDGSYDNSINIIEEFLLNDKRIKLINKKNTGYGNSLNTAIKIAKGKYISIVESDDVIKPEMLEILYNKLKEDDYDIVKACFYLYKGKTLKSYSFNKKIDIKKTQNVFYAPQILTLKPSVWSAIYKKKFLNDNNIFFNETPQASFQDISFQFKAMFLAKKIKFIQDKLYLYRTDNPNSSINSTDKVFEICSEFDSINIFLNNKKTNAAIMNQKILFEFLAYIWNYKRIKNKYNKIFMEKIHSIMSGYQSKDFYKDNKIPFKEKIKFYLLMNHLNIFEYILYIIKNYANK